VAAVPRAVPILLYHDVADDPPAAMRPFSVSPGTFREHLRAIGESGSAALTVSGYLAARDAGAMPERPVVITFDDGSASFADAALPALAEVGLGCTLYVTTGLLEGTPRPVDARPLGPMLHWRHLAELPRESVEIGAHSHSHPQLDTLSRSAAEAEVRVPKALLEEELGEPVASFAYPHGYRSALVRRLVREAGYDSACAVRNALSPLSDDRYSLARLTVMRTTSSAELEAWLAGGGAPVAPRHDGLRTRAWRAYRRARSVVTRTPGRDFG
jgi:peptidoglycan/xylan/chitin deacetylase (PgdA/CDA1 family)